MGNEITVSGLESPVRAMAVADALQKFVKERGLTTNIQGKAYPLVEAWGFAGNQLGLVSILRDVQCLSTEEEIKYSAIVEVIRLADGQILSRGFAVCSNKEGSKRRFDEYAIASMAQTRAVGKAYRNILAWLMKAAGFEATPAEEMDFMKDEPPMDYVTDEQREELLRLLESSTYDERQREDAKQRIAVYDKQEQYEKAKTNLLHNQAGIDGAINPGQREINAKIRRTAKAPVA
jgi:hypothetical protein